MFVGKARAIEAGLLEEESVEAHRDLKIGEPA